MSTRPKRLPSNTPPEFYVQEGKGFLVRNDAEYPRRIEAFSKDFYQPVFGADYPLDAAKQGFVRSFPEFGLQFLLLNSAWEIDEHFRKRSSIHTEALARVMKLSGEQAAGFGPDQGPLQIAVWHHAVQGRGQEQMKDTTFVGHLQKKGVRLAMHGDVHEFRRECIGYWHAPSRLHILGAGSFASPAEGRAESIPRLYNFLQIDRNLTRLRVHTRAQERSEGAWKGWNEWPSRDPRQQGVFSYFDIELRDAIVAG